VVRDRIMLIYPMSAIKKSIAAARKLSKAVDKLHFGEPVSHVYNPLSYAWAAHEQYLGLMNPGGCRVLLLGMNPGPWGMAQTGVPFGQVAAVRDWLGIDVPVKQPKEMHPKRPIEGLACRRSEVSGERLWGLFRDRYESAEAFFEQHFVANYCPLVFMEASGKNRTPDKLPTDERQPRSMPFATHTSNRYLPPHSPSGLSAWASTPKNVCSACLVIEPSRSGEYFTLALLVLPPTVAGPKR